MHGKDEIEFYIYFYIYFFSKELGCHVFKIVNTFTKYAKHEDEKGRKVNSENVSFI